MFLCKRKPIGTHIMRALQCGNHVIMNMLFAMKKRQEIWRYIDSNVMMWHKDGMYSPP